MISFIVDTAFLLYALYSIAHEECIFRLTVFNFVLRMVNHKFAWLSLNIVTIFGISIYTSDIYLLVLIVVLVLERSDSKTLIYRNSIPFMLFFVMVLVSWIPGFIENGMCSEWVGDTRKFFSLVIPVVYFTVHPVEISESDMTFLKYVMRCILLYCYVFWFLALILGVYMTSSESLRCMGADYAFVVSIYALYLLYDDLVRSDNHRIRIETLLFILAVIILQHNTVYASFAVAVAVIVIFEHSSVFSKDSVWILQMICVVALVLVVSQTSIGQTLFASLSDTFDKFEQATSTVAGEEEGTVGTRYIVWRELIDTLDSAKDWLIGKTMGTGYHVAYGSGTWEASPHSGYVEGLMRLGLIGMFCLLLQMIKNFVQHISRGEVLIAAVLASICVYWFSYSFTPEIGFMIGMSIAILNSYGDEDKQFSET